MPRLCVTRQGPYWPGRLSSHRMLTNPDSKVHVANMGPIWVLSAPGGPHIGPVNLVIREVKMRCSHRMSTNPDSKVHVANMGPIWVLSAPGGPHIGPVNLVIREVKMRCYSSDIEQESITMTSQWVGWRLKSPASRLFTQPFIRAQNKENIKAPLHWPLCGEFTGDRWIPRTNGQLRGKCFHLMTSSWHTYNTDFVMFSWQIIITELSSNVTSYFIFVLRRFWSSLLFFFI